jgi:hypothetical protein
MAQIQNLNRPQGSMINGRFTRDLTDANLSSHMAPVTASGGLLVNFFYVRTKTRNRDATHNGVSQTRLCVAKQPRGDRATVAIRYISEKQAAAQFPAEYAAFKETGEVMTTGTPLHELPGISISDIGILAIHGLRSVEDLLSLSDDEVGQMGRDATRAYKVAQTWHNRLNENRETVDLAELKTNADIERKTLQETIAKQEAAMKTMQMQIDAMMKANQDRITAQSAMPGNSNHVDSTVTAVESDDADLPYDLADMDDPMSEGPDVAFGSEDLGASDDVNPLAD